VLAKEWCARAEAAESAGNDVEAVRAYACSMRMMAQASTVYSLARVAQRSGDVELALQSYRAYLTLKPDASEETRCRPRSGTWKRRSRESKRSASEKSHQPNNLPR